MKITPKFTFVSGSFDTDEVKMLCLPSDNHGKVDLCIKEKDCAWNIPIGGVKLHDRDLYVDFKATLEDAAMKSQGVGMSMKNGTNAKRTQTMCQKLLNGACSV